MIGYKATDKDLKCREFQYEIGSEYVTTSDRQLIKNHCLIPPKLKEDKFLKLCSNQVIHYCNDLVDCFTYYPYNKNNRFFKVKILGSYNSIGDKSGTTRLRFLEELSKEEIEKAIKEEEFKKEEKNLKLNEIRELQNKFPNLILGGSLALYLQGLKLNRLKDYYNTSDFDFIHPFWVNLSEVDGVKFIDAKNSGNTFDETYETKSKTKIDLVINPHCKYKIVEFNGNKYKVNTIENILKYKTQYATQRNGEKHRDDLYELLNFQK